MNIKDTFLTTKEEEKQQGAHELRVVKRALRRCKWHEFGKRKVLKAHADLIKFIYEI